MTIMYLLTTGYYSGAEKVIITIIKQLNTIYRAVYVSPRGTIGGILEQEKIEYIPIDKLNFKVVNQVVNELKPDIIHANDFRASIYASIFFRQSKIISHIHCNPIWIKKINLNSIAYGLVSIRFSRILNVSNAFENEYIFKNKIMNKCKTIGNPISLNDFLEQTKKTAENEKKYDVIYVGRLSREKNPLKFIEIFYNIWKENNQLTAVMIGDGSLRKKCEILIQKKKIAAQIDMLGFQNNVCQYMKNCKVMVIPSKYEGFGLAAVEALALGKPVVAANVGGLPNIVTERCGALCTNEDEFVDSVRKILNDEAAYHLMSKEAKKQACQFDNLQLYMKELCDVYDDCEK